MAKESYAQPATCNKMVSISTAIEWEARRGSLLGEALGTVTHESISQRRILLDSHLPLTKQAMIIG